MKVIVFGRNQDSIRSRLKDHALHEVENTPDVVISGGGDGTFLDASRAYPDLPILPVRDPERYAGCRHKDIDDLLEGLSARRLSLTRCKKLVVETSASRIIATADVVLRQVKPTQAIRFTVTVNDETLSDAPLVGDGMIAASVYGATGYFRSVSGMVFTQGLGVAFNNLVCEPYYLGVPVSGLILDENDVIRAEIVRGPAYLGWDNSDQSREINQSESFLVRLADRYTRIYGLEAFRCRLCERRDSHEK